MGSKIVTYEYVYYSGMNYRYDWIGEWKEVDGRYIRVLSIRDEIRWETETSTIEPLTYYHKN